MTTAQLQQIASEIPTPVDEYGACRAYLGRQPAANGEVIRVYFGRDGGRRREWVGPAFGATDLAAYRLVGILNARTGQS